jgi:putative ABC transport system permease protein
MFRATVKSLLSRKLRLFLSTTAVVLGVMFVSGALVLTDTLGRSFDGLFTTIYEYTDIQVTKESGVSGLNGQPAPAKLPMADVDRVAAVAGVKSANGQVFLDGARVVGKNGKTVLGSGGPRFGASWEGEDALLKIRQGTAPRSDDEIVISANLARTTTYTVGDKVGVVTPFGPKKRQFTVSGIAEYSGGRDSLAGETTVLFTERVAQELMLGEAGVFSVIDVKLADGSSLTDVRDRIGAAMGSAYQVRTGEELAADSAKGTQEALDFFSYLLLGFAAVALFVGTFLILNTFSIIVAQRTRELALFRAMGSSRGQVIGSVLLEAVVIGLLASIIGLVLGIAVGAILGGVMGSALSGGALKLAGLAVPASAVIASFAVGVGITVVAALLPAFRASRIPPVAAMREPSIPDRPLTVLSISGAVILALGGTLLGLGLTGNLGDADLEGFLAGLLISFVGVALLTPLVSRPVVGLVGRLFAMTAAGKLGRRNSSRHPRRTAITASALMIGIALITGISVILSSVRESTAKAVDENVHAELIIAGDAVANVATIDPEAVEKIRDLPGVASTVAIYADLVKLNGTDDFGQAVDDLPAALRVFDMATAAGTLAPIRSGNVIVDDKTAADRRLTAGSTITVQMARSPAMTYTVQGIYTKTAVNAGFFFSMEDIRAGFGMPAPLQAYVSLSPGASVDAVRGQVDNLLKDSPEVSVSKLDEYLALQTQIFDFVLIFVQLLLGLAMIIAVLGIINTLALSMTERTHELGLLRAVGMRRGQVIWMVTVESIVISVFGALLGIAVGAGLGASVFQALRDFGFTSLSFPWPLMAAYVIASVFVGLIAALIPAIRASRLDVLKAIAYE